MISKMKSSDSGTITSPKIEKLCIFCNENPIRKQFLRNIATFNNICGSCARKIDIKVIEASSR